MTAIAEAMQAAGVQAATAEQRLKAIAAEAVAGSNRNWDVAKDLFFAKVRGDASLLWELLTRWRAAAAERYIREAFEELRLQNRPAPETAVGGELGPTACDNHSAIAQLAVSPESVAGRLAPGPHSVGARDASAAAGRAAVAAVARLSLLDTIKVNGKPLGDVTPMVAREWAATREKMAKATRAFVVSLTENLPPSDPIRKFRSPEDTQALYDKAMADNGK